MNNSSGLNANIQQTIANFNNPIKDEEKSSSVSTISEPYKKADIGNNNGYTIDDAVEHFGFGKAQILLSFFAGFLWMADAMEVMILSILSPALACEWGITPIQEALITTCVFGGMLVASTPWGIFCDRFGRRTMLLIIAGLTSVLGVCSAFSPNFYTFLILRTLTGVCIAGLPQSVTYYSEFLPISHRAKCIVLLEVFWALGSVFESGVALLIMEPLGWRWLLAISSIPLLISAFTCLVIPESPRFLMISGCCDDAYDTLEKLAKLNGSQMLEGKLIESAEKIEGEKRGSFLNLFSHGMFLTTSLVWLIWFIAAFCYYGIILFTTVLFQTGDSCHGATATNQKHTLAVSANETYILCNMLTQDDYMGFMYTSIAELLGIFLMFVLVELIGRKRTMALSFLIYSAFTSLLTLCFNRNYITLLISVARAFICGAFQVAYVYTPEIYPTTMRAVGLGSASGTARLGALLTPFVAQVVSKDISMNGPPLIYGVSGILATLASLLLPIETRGRRMMDRMGERSSRDSTH